MSTTASPTRPPLPHDVRAPVSAQLLGCTTRLVPGRRSTHRVIEAGDGPPLLLLHGIGGHADVWARNLRRLAQRYHVYAVDMLYHGYSTRTGHGDDLVGELADAVVDLLDALGHERAAIEGESLGAGVAFEVAMTHPDRVWALVCNTGFGLVDLPEPVGVDLADAADLAQRSAHALTDLSDATIRRRLEWLVHDPADITDEMVAIRKEIYADPATNASLARVMRFTERPPAPRWTVDQVHGLEVPTLVLWTEHNPIQKPAYGQAVAALVPGGRFHCLTGVGHWPQWESPEEHDAVVTAFLIEKEG